MRICHVIQSLDPAHGGPTTVAARLCSAIAALGHEVTLIGGIARERQHLAEDALSQAPGIEQVRVHLVDFRDRLDRVSGRPLVRAYASVATPDVVHFHGVWEASLVRISMNCRQRGIPYLVRPCGMLDAWSLRQNVAKKRLALATTHRAYLRGAGAIHALNAHERDAVEMLGLGVPVSVIPNGVFLDELARITAPGAFRASEPRLGERRFVLFLSRMHIKKGLDLLADAWIRVAARLPGCALVVAGPREDDSVEIFRQRIEAVGLTGTVIETGPIFGDLKTAALRECDVFVLPSRQEGFSLAITEALALGTPVVITEECHFPEVAEVGAGWVVPLDVGAIAAGLENALREPTARATFGAAGARLVRERFTWPAIAARSVELYDQLRRRPPESERGPRRRGAPGAAL